MHMEGQAAKELADQLAKAYGLDKPIVVQYFLWMGNIFKGNLGFSFMYTRPVGADRRAAGAHHDHLGPHHGLHLAGLVPHRLLCVPTPVLRGRLPGQHGGVPGPRHPELPPGSGADVPGLRGFRRRRDGAGLDEVPDLAVEPAENPGHGEAALASPGGHRDGRTPRGLIRILLDASWTS